MSGKTPNGVSQNRPTKHVIKATQLRFGELAQLGERLVCNQEVTGSSPVFSTSLRSRAAWRARGSQAKRATAGKPAFEVSKAVARAFPQGSGQVSVPIPMVKLLRAYGECLGARSR